jgi:ABC-type glycerol-3-phosphate transport system substrate-binding protein
MRKMKLTAIVMAAVLAFSAIPAMAGEVITSTDGTIADEDLGWEKPEETVTFSVYAGEGDPEEAAANPEGTDTQKGRAFMDAWLLEHMNIAFDWQVMIGDMTERLNLMLTDGSYPEIITWMPDDMANKFIAQGKAVDLTPYLEKMPNLTRRMGNYLNLLKSDDGNLYKLAIYWGFNPNVAGQDFGVRYDYWLELGKDKMYETPQEWMEVMKEILANHPTNEAGQTTYACTSDNQGRNFLSAMMGAYGFVMAGVNGYKYVDGEYKHWLNTDEGLEFSKLVNQMYREGLIDPDYQSVDYETYTSKETSGQVLGNLGTWWYAWTGGHQKWALDEGDDYKKEKRIANVAVHGEGVDFADTTLLTANFIGSYRMIITDKASEEQIEEIVKYLNWEASEIGNFIMGFGPPMEENVWKITEDGIWQFDDEIMDVDRKEDSYHPVKDSHGGMIYGLALNCNWLRDDDLGDFTQIDPRVTRVSVYDYWPINPEDGSFADEGINISWGNYANRVEAKDTTMNTTVFDPYDPITTTKTDIEDAVTAGWAEIITADSEEACVEAFERLRDDCNGMGLEDLTAYYEASYEKNLAVFNGEE